MHPESVHGLGLLANMPLLFHNELAGFLPLENIKTVFLLSVKAMPL